ncbi:MAG: HD domain-containing protein, partial [Deltaproteobacteria bacterium]|nr:HD domain-containing protein [Deltaproteobacteria bacterium]
MKVRVFRDPVHGIIDMSGADEPLEAILETRAFQRLRRIHQMGFAWLVYAGAEHSRFGHALGAYHVATRVAPSLGLDPEVARHVKVAALLHDIGHGPFSHTWEQVFAGADHEDWGARIVTEDDELAGVLSKIEDGLPETIAKFSDKTYVPAMARKLVSSQLDVDRLDYLLRDGHYSGVGYATYDLDWIIHALQTGAIHSSPDSTDLVIDHRRGMYAVEQYLFARSYMYAQVYHHKTVRSAEWMFLKLMHRFAELARKGQEPPNLPTAAEMARGALVGTSSYLGLDDWNVMTAIDSWARGGELGENSRSSDPVLSDLASRLVARRLFKTVDLGDDPRIIDDIRDPIESVARRHFGELAGYYYELDSAKQVGYQAEDDAEELHVVGHPRYGTVTLGRLMDDLPLGRPIATVRLVCAPELLT